MWAPTCNSGTAARILQVCLHCTLLLLPVLLQHKVLESAVAKDMKDLSQFTNKTFTTLHARLEERFSAIEALNEKYQHDLHASWEAYNDDYATLDAAKEQVVAAVDKRRTALKRKADRLRDEARERLAEAERKLAKIRTAANKLPGLGDALKAALGA